MGNFKIEWSDRFCRVELFGSISMNDIDSANAVINADKRYYAVKSSLWDFTAADMSQIGPDDIDSAVAVDIGADRVLAQHQKLAFLVAGSHEQHLCECYVNEMKQHNTTWSFGIFTTEIDALTWTHA